MSTGKNAISLPSIEEIRQRVTGVMPAFPEVKAVFLFGSMAEGRSRVDSDIDLAVVPEKGRSGKIRLRKLDFLAALVKAGLDHVDLAILDDNDVVLRYEAVRPNYLLYAREDFDLGAYYSRALREYLDFLPFLKLQRKALRQRLLHAWAGGDSQTSGEAGRIPEHTGKHPGL